MSAITVTTRPDGVAVLTFDQPGSKANVLTGELWTEFGEALAGLASRTDLKGLVLASAKPGIFIAGADLKLLANAPGPNDPDVRAFIELGLRVLEQLEALPFPTCAAIDGASLGGGLEVALACDQRVISANPKVQLGLPEVKLGLIPGWGGTQRLPRIVGPGIAERMILSGESKTPRGTNGHSLASAIFPSETLVADATAWVHTTTTAAERIERELNHTQGYWKFGARRLKCGPVRPDGPNKAPAIPQDSTAAAEAVRVMTEGASLTLYDAIALETEAFMRLAGSDESKRLIAEFFASRKK